MKFRIQSSTVGIASTYLYSDPWKVFVVALVSGWQIQPNHIMSTTIWVSLIWPRLQRFALLPDVHGNKDCSSFNQIHLDKVGNEILLAVKETGIYFKKVTPTCTLFHIKTMKRIMNLKRMTKWKKAVF